MSLVEEMTWHFADGWWMMLDDDDDDDDDDGIYL